MDDGWTLHVRRCTWPGPYLPGYHVDDLLHASRHVRKNPIRRNSQRASNHTCMMNPNLYPQALMDLEQLESLRGCNMAIEAVLSRDPSLQGIGMSPLFHPLAPAGRDLGDDPGIGSAHRRGRRLQDEQIKPATFVSPPYQRRGATPAVRQSVPACVQASSCPPTTRGACESLPSINTRDARVEHGS